MTDTTLNGSVTLVKALAQHDLWLAEPFNRAQAWVDLLLLANDQPRTIRLAGQPIQLERGQLGWSHVSLADRWRWSRPKVIGFLQELAERGMVKLAPNNRTTVITIANYGTYNRPLAAELTAPLTPELTPLLTPEQAAPLTPELTQKVEGGSRKGCVSAHASPDSSPIAAAGDIVAAYPVQTDRFEAERVVLGWLEEGEDAAAMLKGTQAIAQVIAQIPSAHLNRFVPSPVRFFREKKWADRPQDWVRRFALEVKSAGMGKAFPGERPPEGARRTMKVLTELPTPIPA